MLLDYSDHKRTGISKFINNTAHSLQVLTFSVSEKRIGQSFNSALLQLDPKCFKEWIMTLLWFLQKRKNVLVYSFFENFSFTPTGFARLEMLKRLFIAHKGTWPRLTVVDVFNLGNKSYLCGRTTSIACENRSCQKLFFNPADPRGIT